MAKKKVAKKLVMMEAVKAPVEHHYIPPIHDLLQEARQLRADNDRLNTFLRTYCLFRKRLGVGDLLTRAETHLNPEKTIMRALADQVDFLRNTANEIEKRLISYQTKQGECASKCKVFSEHNRVGAI